MSEQVLCSCSHATVKGKQNTILQDISLAVGRKQIVALISEDGSAGDVLKLIAGLYTPDSGRVAYPALKRQDTTVFPKKLQYVPDDIVCYSNLKVWDFLHGIAKGQEQMLAQAERMLALFGINAEEELLEMTFEQNRLVSMIQAVMAAPSLLLLNRPYDMLKEETYRQLLKEIAALYARGSGIVLASQDYKNVILPCHEYIFLKKGRVVGHYEREELPHPAKVVTMWGGSLHSLLPDKMEILAQERNYVRFLYREQNMQELAIRLGVTGCDNFNIEELTMEEELFEDYERWI